jgi:DNA-binding response OmpR family regulator
VAAVRLLVVEDNRAELDALVAVLRKDGFSVEGATTGAEALDRLDNTDLVLLDLGLPDIDGFTLCWQIRATRQVPIIVVSGRPLSRDRTLALNAGADDYVVKDYDSVELIAHINAVLRRTRSSGSGQLVRSGDVEIDLGRHLVTVDGRLVRLDRLPFQVLTALAEAKGKMLSRDRLLAEVWDDTSPERLDELLATVASIGDTLKRPELIQPVGSVGYRLVLDQPQPERD